MKRVLQIVSLVLVALSAAALYLVPVLWRPERVTVIRIGLGAAIFVMLFITAVLIQVIVLTNKLGREGAERSVNRARDETHRQFLHRLDHELKNPLTGLQTALTNLREAESAEDIRLAVENASLAANRLGRILGDLRKLSQLDAQMLECRPVDVGEMVSEMVSAAASLPAHQGRNVRLMVPRVPASPSVTGDCDMLGLAVYNLIDNALKFTATPDAVEVLVHEDGRSLYIDVADSGAGIPAGEQQRIFEDLYRGQNASEIEGSGLGLPLARRIVQLHGGDLYLRSDPDRGRGTVFTIRLPVERKMESHETVTHS